MRKPTSFTQYCDDVRREADGRPSLMGVYPAHAIVDLDGRDKLPKVCAYTVLSLPLVERLISIVVTTSWNDEEVGRVEIPENVVSGFNNKLEAAPRGKNQLMLATAIQIRDLEIGDGGKLLTKVLVNDAIIESRLLKLKPRQDESSLSD
ncbi:MAG: hypothetical protein GX772_06305 [Alcaligenaceae bacterium]|nr:hypothetical protein [Alcaligenaceae bacterium]